MCGGGEHFAKKVVDKIEERMKRDYDYEGSIVIKTSPKTFPNDELKTIIDQSIRNKDVYIFQDVENRSFGFSLNDNYVDLKTTIDSTRRSDARRITAVIPYYPYSRQDKAKGREGITAAMVARELEDVGANRVITLDIHNEATAGFFRKAHFDNLHASKEIMRYVVEKIGTDDLVIVSPDTGGAQRAEYYGKRLGVPFAIAAKFRDYSKRSHVDKMYLLGDVEGKNVFFIDDMIATAGTLGTGAELVKNHGANKVYFGVSHGLFNDPAFERVSEAYKKGILNGVVVSNTIHQEEKYKKNPWYNEVPVENYFAKAIINTHRGESLSKLLE